MSAPGPTTRAAALAAWRAQSLRLLSELGLELAAVESLVREGIIDRRLDAAVESAWDFAGRLGRIACGPEVSAEEVTTGAEAPSERRSPQQLAYRSVAPGRAPPHGAFTAIRTSTSHERIPMMDTMTNAPDLVTATERVTPLPLEGPTQMTVEKTQAEEVAQSYQTAENRYLYEMRDRQLEAMAQPKALRVHRRIKRLANRALKDFGNLREFRAYAAAASLDPRRPQSVVAAYEGLCHLMNADDRAWKARGHAEFFEPTEDLELLLAVGSLLQMLRIAPGLRFYPHRADLFHDNR